MFKNSLDRTVSLGLAALVVLLVSPAAHADSATKAAQKALKKQAEESEENLDDCYHHALGELKAALKGIESAVDAGELAAEAAIDAAAGAGSTFSNNLDSHANYVLWEMNGAANALLAELGGEVPAGFLAGDCGTWDKFIHQLDAGQLKYLKKGLKKLKAFQKKMKLLIDAGGDIKVVVNVQVFIAPPPKPAPGNPAPAPKKLKINSASSAHDSKKNNDGKISIRGQAPAAGTVKVRIQGPNGTDITKIVPVDANCNFNVGFPNAPGSGPGNLPEGNYKVTVTQGEQTSVQNHGV